LKPNKHNINVEQTPTIKFANFKFAIDCSFMAANKEHKEVFDRIAKVSHVCNFIFRVNTRNEKYGVFRSTNAGKFILFIKSKSLKTNNIIHSIVYELLIFAHQ